MIELYTFYNDILSKLPFSIKGYNNIEDKINNFFNILVKNSYFRSLTNIEFLSYSYSRITENGIDSWSLKDFSNSFFFHSLNEKYSFLLLNFWGYLKQKLKVEFDTDTKNKFFSNLLAYLFIDDFSFRLKYTLQDNWSLSYLNSKNVLSVKLPISRIFTLPNKKSEIDINSYDRHFRLLLSNFLKAFIKILALNEKSKYNEILYVSKKNDNVYLANGIDLSKFEKTDIGKVHKEFYDNLFVKKHELEELIVELKIAINQFHDSNPGLFNTSDFDKLSRNWIISFIPIFFLSYSLNCWLEYLPSVCGEFENKNELRNLGGLIIGYKAEPEISLNDRAFFKIISDKISSSIAVDIMHSYLQLDIIRQASECFGMHGMKQITHMNFDNDSESTDRCYFNSQAEICFSFAKKQLNTLIEQVARLINNSPSNEYASQYKNILINILNEANKNNFKEVKILRDQIQYKDNKIKESIETCFINAINDKKLVFLKSNSRYIEFYFDHILYLKESLSAMFVSIFNQYKETYGTKDILFYYFYSIYDEIPNDPYLPIKNYRSYIIFYHYKESVICIDENKDIPKWWDSIAKNGFPICNFYYGYDNDKETKLYKIESKVPKETTIKKEFDKDFKDNETIIEILKNKMPTIDFIELLNNKAITNNSYKNSIFEKEYVYYIFRFKYQTQ